MQGKELTADQKTAFIKKLKSTNGNVSKAAQAAKVSRAAMYQHKEKDKGFSATWEETIEAIVDDMEAECYRRAVKGVMKPVYQGGRKVGSIREFSDGLLQFALKGKRPEIYRDKMDINQKISGALDVNIETEIDKLYDEPGED